MSTRWILAIVAPVVLASGCSQTDSAAAINTPTASAAGTSVAAPGANNEVKSTPAAPGSTALTPEKSATASAPSTSAKPKEPAVAKATGDNSREPNEAADLDSLFAPPKDPPPPIVKQPEVVVAPTAQEEPKKKEQPRPPLRLVGFVEMESLQALLSVDGELNILTEGDAVGGIELVAIQPPFVTLKHAEEEFQIDLLQQPWQTNPATEPPRAGPAPPPRRSPSPRSTGPSDRWTLPTPPTRPAAPPTPPRLPANGKDPASASVTALPTVDIPPPPASQPVAAPNQLPPLPRPGSPPPPGGGAYPAPPIR